MISITFLLGSSSKKKRKKVPLKENSVIAELFPPHLELIFSLCVCVSEKHSVAVY